MGPTALDLAFFWVGSLMIMAGLVLWLVLEHWQNLRDSSPMFPATPPVFISFGLASATNGLVLGYGKMMPTMALGILMIISIATTIWCAFTLNKLIKLTYSKTAPA